MDFDCRIVFSDIDGTFLDSRHQVQPGTVFAAQWLADRGIPVVLVSARMPAAIRPVLTAAGIKAPIIGYSGALVLDMAGQPLYSHTMEREDALHILSQLRQRWPRVVVNYYAEDVWYVQDDQVPEVRREEKITAVKAVIAEFSVLLSQGCLPHKLLCMGEPPAVAEMEKVLQAEFPELTVVRSSPILLEIMAAGISKAVGIGVLLETLSLPAADALAFGDNYNDLEMLACVGMGVAMGNAPAAVKAASAAVTAGNDGEGIAAFLKKLFPAMEPFR